MDANLNCAKFADLTQFSVRPVVEQYTARTFPV